MPDDELPDQLRRHGRQRRRPALHDDRHELVGAVRDPVAMESQHLAGVLHRPEDRAGHDVRSQLVEPELELGDDAEVAPATPHAPEQVGVLVLARRQHLPVGGDDVDGLQLIDREAVLAHDPADPTAERQAGHAGVGDDPGRHGEPESLGLAIELAEQHAGLRPHGPLLGVDPHAFHRAEVDQQPVIAHRQSGEAVPAAAHGDQQPSLLGEADGGADIGDPGASRDESRVPIDRAVPHLAVLVISRIARADELAVEHRLQLLDGRAVDQRPRSQ